ETPGGWVFRLDPSRQPKAVDFLLTSGPHQGKTVRAIYALDGDELRVYLAPAGQARPTTFAANTGWLYILLRAAGQARRKPGQGKEPDHTTGMPPEDRPGSRRRQPVAYIFDTVPITREELADYLIARGGADRLEQLVNQRILEEACRAKGITVSAAEVAAGLEEDLKRLQVSRREFTDRVLKQY